MHSQHLRIKVLVMRGARDVHAARSPRPGPSTRTDFSTDPQRLQILDTLTQHVHKVPALSPSILNQPCGLPAASEPSIRTDALLSIPSSCVLPSTSHQLFSSGLSSSQPCHCRHVSVDSIFITDPLSICQANVRNADNPDPLFEGDVPPCESFTFDWTIEEGRPRSKARSTGTLTLSRSTFLLLTADCLNPEIPADANALPALKPREKDILEHAITESEKPVRRTAESAPSLIAGTEGPMTASRAVGKNEERWIMQQDEILDVVTTPGESRVSLADYFSKLGHWLMDGLVFQAQGALEESVL